MTAPSTASGFCPLLRDPSSEMTCSIGALGRPHLMPHGSVSHRPTHITWSGSEILTTQPWVCWGGGGRCFLPSVGTPTRRCAFSQGGVFSHVQGEVFFGHPGHMLAPSENSCGDLYPRILFPHAFSPLLLPPTPWRPWKWCVDKQRPLDTR